MGRYEGGPEEERGVDLRPALEAAKKVFLRVGDAFEGGVLVGIGGAAVVAGFVGILAGCPGGGLPIIAVGSGAIVRGISDITEGKQR